MKGLKFVETLRVRFEKQTGHKEKAIKTAYFNSIAQTVINKTQIELALKLSKQISNKIAQWISEGSVWVIQTVDNHYLNFVKYEPMKCSSYITLPKELKSQKKGLINLQNKDDECFRWCHVRYLNPQKKNPNRIAKADRKFMSQLNYDKIDFPIKLNQVNKIEKQNSISVNVFGHENKQPYPIYISKETYDNHMDLLLITEENKSHYLVTKDFNRFIFLSNKTHTKKHFCMYCLQCFSSENVLTNHKESCLQVNGTQAIKIPEKGSKVKLMNFHKQLPVPFVIYADF